MEDKDFDEAVDKLPSLLPVPLSGDEFGVEPADPCTLDEELNTLSELEPFCPICGLIPV